MVLIGFCIKNMKCLGFICRRSWGNEAFILIGSTVEWWFSILKYLYCYYSNIICNYEAIIVYIKFINAIYMSMSYRLYNYN